MFPLELLADLPEPGRDEPASLRIDIADELTDHLACAFRREVLRDGDEAAARRRALDRFGDPKQIARQLWWQAMWSRIMKQRIVFALQWSVALVAMLISGAVFWQQSQMLAEIRQARVEEATQRKEDAAQREALTAKLDQLQLQTRAPEAPAGVPVPADPVSITLPPVESDFALVPQRPAQPFEAADRELRTADQTPVVPPPNSSQGIGPSRLTVKLVQGTPDGPPFIGGVEQIRLTDNRGGGAVAVPLPDPAQVRAPVKTPVGTPVADAPITYGFFGAYDPGHYELVVTLSDGQHSRRPVLIRDGMPQDLTIVCPAPRQKASLQISVPPLPEDLREAVLYLDVMILERPLVLDDVEWQTASAIGQTLTFDPKTGKAIRLTREDPQGDPSEQRVDLRKVKPEDCLVFVDSGTIALGFQLGLLGPTLSPNGPRNVYPVQFPDQSPLPDALLRTAQPGENRWQLALPDEFLAAARAQKKSLSSSLSASGYPEPVLPAPLPDELPVSAPKKPQLTIKCVPDHADGPAVKVQHVTIHSAEVEAGANRIFSGDDELFVFESLPPDQYELTIVLADAQNQTSTQPLLIDDEKPRELKIVCPGPRKKVPVNVTLQPLPEKLRKLNFETVQMTVFPGPLEVGKNRWMTQNLSSQTITFDARSGLPRTLDVENASGKQQHFDLSELPADERRLFLPMGTVVYHFRMHERTVGSRPVPVFYWPKSRQEEDCPKHVIQGDEKKWVLELPQEYLDEALEGPHTRSAEEPKLLENDSEHRTDNRSKPNPYAHESGFKWIRGVARFDEESKSWAVVYSPELNDSYRGSLTLAADPKLSQVKPNDVLLVIGEVDQSRIDRFGKPKYRIDELQRLRPKRPQLQARNSEIDFPFLDRLELTIPFD